MFMQDYYTRPQKVKQQRFSSSNQFCGYCNRLCRSSLITGFPVIASTKSIFRKLVKTCVFLLCAAGFFYQTSDFLRMYFAYPTNVDVSMYIPEQFELPAITVCNKNRVKRKKLCEQQKDKCAWEKNLKQFCQIYPRYCIPGEDEEDVVLATINNDYLTAMNNSWSYVQAMGFSQRDTIRQCSVTSEGNKRSCKNYMYVPAVDTQGHPNNCFTAESLWGDPDAVVQQIPTTTSIKVQLKLYPQEYLKPTDIVQFYFAVHDAYMLMNPMLEGIMLEGGKNYNIYVTQRKFFSVKVVKVFLPLPYVTNCTDYMKSWRKNGGYGPVNQKMCIEKCKMDAMLKNFACVDRRISYPSNNTICLKDKQFLNHGELSNVCEKLNYRHFLQYKVNNRAVVSACSKMCRPACRDITYHVRTEVKEDMATRCSPSNKVCHVEEAILSFEFSRMEVTQFEHQPKYESVEMFSYIGGYMGMWLGISLVALFDFLETIGYLVYYPCKRKARRRTKKFHHFNNQKLFYRRYD